MSFRRSLLLSLLSLGLTSAASATTVRARFAHTDFTGRSWFVPFAEVEVWDEDSPTGGGDDHLATGHINASGLLEIPNVNNGDCLGCGTADIYLKLRFKNNGMGHRVKTVGGNDYLVKSPVWPNAPNGVIDFGTLTIPVSTGESAAAGIWLDMMHARWVLQGAGIDPGPVASIFPRNDLDVSRTVGDGNGLGIGIPSATVRHSVLTMHEYHHVVLFNHGIFQGPTSGEGRSHSLFTFSDSPETAFSEGFAHYFAFATLAAAGRISAPVFDIPEIPRYQKLNFETFRKTDDGSNFFDQIPVTTGSDELSEGRILGALWDVSDGGDDGLDRNNGQVIDVRQVLQVTINNGITRFGDFWGAFRGSLSDAQRARAVGAILNNTILVDGEEITLPANPNTTTFSFFHANTGRDDVLPQPPSRGGPTATTASS